MYLKRFYGARIAADKKYPKTGIHGAYGKKIRACLNAHAKFMAPVLSFFFFAYFLPTTGVVMQEPVPRRLA